MSRIKEYYLNNIEDFNDIDYIDNEIQQFNEEISKEVDFSQNDEYLFI